MRRLLVLYAVFLAACSGGSSDSSPPPDTTVPIITLVGNNPQLVFAGDTYTELGATATDNVDGDLSGSIVVDAAAVDTAIPGDYSVTYDVNDAAGNKAVTVTRIVRVEDNTPPVITLAGADPQLLTVGDVYVELGATATDNVDGDLTNSIIVDAAAVNTGTAGNYIVTYYVSDAAGNEATIVSRTVTVENPPLPAKAQPTVAGEIKRLVFSWASVTGAAYYRLLENANGHSGFVQVGDDVPAGTLSIDRGITVHLFDYVNAQYIIEACNISGCSSSDIIMATSVMLDTIGYFKASNTEAGDQFGHSGALSGDGRTLAVGAPFEDSGSAGINGDQTDNSATDAGAVYLFRFDGNAWTQQAYIKASNPGGYVGWEYIADRFGWSIALSNDGNTLAVGAPGEDGDDGPDQDEGAVYVFNFDGTNWHERDTVKGQYIYGTRQFMFWGSRFGSAVALSANGDTLAAGAIGDHVNIAEEAGSAYVFRYQNLSWSQQAYLKSTTPNDFSIFGNFLSLSFDGNTLAVGDPNEDSSAAGINGDPTISLEDSGAAHVFHYDGLIWSQQAYIKSTDPTAYSYFGAPLSLSGDGIRLAISAPEGIVMYGFDGTDWYQGTFPITNRLGNVYLNESGEILTVHATDRVQTFKFDGAIWNQQSSAMAINDGVFVLSTDGMTMAVQASGDDSGATGINGDQNDTSEVNSGAVYVY